MGESDDKLTSSPNQVSTVLPLGTPAIGVFGSEGAGQEGDWNKGDGGTEEERRKRRDKIERSIN